MGKTSFGTSMMYNIAQSGVPSLMISIEMPRLQIIRKIIAGRCLIKEGNIANNDMSSEDWMKFETCAEELSDLKLFIDDKSRSLFEVIASIRSHVRRFDVKFVVVDYVQRIKVPTRDARYLEVGEVVDDLAELSKSLGINIMLLSQINRGVEGEPVNVLRYRICLSLVRSKKLPVESFFYTVMTTMTMTAGTRVLLRCR